VSIVKIAIYNLHFATLGGGERRTCALAVHLARKHDVTIFVQSSVPLATIKRIFGFDLSNVKIIALEHKDHAEEILRCKPDLFINNSHLSKLPNPARRGIYMCMFPDLSTIDLRSYQIVTANSRFTAKWIDQRWGCQSEVVYSACQDMGPPLMKEKVLLNVGRFLDTQTGHHKRQEILLRAFKELVDAGLHGWELQLVGTIGPGSENKEFVERLRDAAAGYPIHIRPGIKFDELRQAYQKSSIYWHATGFGTSEVKQPGQQEHFGMSIIEAMSAGAVPIAFNSGGPREVINPAINGYLWNDLEELKDLSTRLIQDPQSLRSMAISAILRSKTFDLSEFLARMDCIIERIMAPTYNSRLRQRRTTRLKMKIKELAKPAVKYLIRTTGVTPRWG